MDDQNARLEKSIQNLGPDLHPEITGATDLYSMDKIELLMKKIHALETENLELREAVKSLWAEMRDQIHGKNLEGS